MYRDSPCACHNSPWIFGKLTGACNDRTNIGRTLRAALKHAGCGSYGLHALRHSFATAAIASGADIPAVSEVLGHSNPGFTLKQYGHADAARQLKAAKSVADMVFGEP